MGPRSGPASCACGLAAQLRFLTIHIGPDRASGDRTDPGSKDPLGAVAAPADEVAEHVAAKQATRGANCGA